MGKCITLFQTNCWYNQSKNGTTTSFTLYFGIYCEHPSRLSSVANLERVNAIYCEVPNHLHFVITTCLIWLVAWGCYSQLYLNGLVIHPRVITTPRFVKDRHWLAIFTGILVNWKIWSESTTGISNYTVTHPCLNFNGGLAKPPLKLKHGWIITQYKAIVLLLHDKISNTNYLKRTKMVVWHSNGYTELLAWICSMRFV